MIDDGGVWGPRDVVPSIKMINKYRCYPKENQELTLYENISIKLNML